MKKILYTLLIIHSSLLIVLAQVQQEWARRYPDTNTFNAFAYSLALDDSGNVYVTGSTSTQGNLTNGYCTIKYSSSGVQQWVANYYSNNSGGRYAYAIALDKSSNVFITGYSYENGRYFDYCTIKYNSNGVQQWVQYYDGPIHGDDEAEEIAVDNAGNVYVSGFSRLVEVMVMFM